jgi:hypothetical protein
MFKNIFKRIKEKRIMNRYIEISKTVNYNSPNTFKGSDTPREGYMSSEELFSNIGIKKITDMDGNPVTFDNYIPDHVFLYIINNSSIEHIDTEYWNTVLMINMINVREKANEAGYIV